MSRKRTRSTAPSPAKTLTDIEYTSLGVEANLKGWKAYGEFARSIPYETLQRIEPEIIRVADASRLQAYVDKKLPVLMSYSSQQGFKTFLMTGFNRQLTAHCKAEPDAEKFLREIWIHSTHGCHAWAVFGTHVMDMTTRPASGSGALVLENASTSSLYSPKMVGGFHF
jgi:hypothetical protein